MKFAHRHVSFSNPFSDEEGGTCSRSGVCIINLFVWGLCKQCSQYCSGFKRCTIHPATTITHTESGPQQSTQCKRENEFVWTKTGLIGEKRKELAFAFYWNACGLEALHSGRSNACWCMATKCEGFAFENAALWEVLSWKSHIIAAWWFAFWRFPFQLCLLLRGDSLALLILTRFLRLSTGAEIDTFSCRNGSTVELANAKAHNLPVPKTKLRSIAALDQVDGCLTIRHRWVVQRTKLMSHRNLHFDLCRRCLPRLMQAKVLTKHYMKIAQWFIEFTSTTQRA